MKNQPHDAYEDRLRTLVDLPTELLFKILQEPGSNKATISRISRRLNSVITSLYLSSKCVDSLAMPIPSLEIVIDLADDGDDAYSHLFQRGPLVKYEVTKTTYIDEWEDELAILTTAMDITGILQLVCKFNPIPKTSKPRTGNMFQYKGQYVRLASFIRRLTRLDKVVLKLEQTNLFEGSRSGAGKHDAWAESVNTLLNACVESGCWELEVWNGTWPKKELNVIFEDPEDLKIKRNSRFKSLPFNAISKLGGLTVALVDRIRSIRLLASNQHTTVSRKPRILSPAWKGVGWEFEALTVTGPRIRETSLSSSALTSTNVDLTTLFIASPSLLLPPHSHWLYQLFTLSPSIITNLTIHRINLHESFWQASFSWIMATHLHTNLTVLTISGCQTLPKDPLVEFLDHFKELKHLVLVPPLPTFELEDKKADDEERRERPRIDLPKLEVLSVPWDWDFLFRKKERDSGRDEAVPTQEV